MKKLIIIVAMLCMLTGCGRENLEKRLWRLEEGDVGTVELVTKRFWDIKAVKQYYAIGRISRDAYLTIKNDKTKTVAITFNNVENL